MFTGIIEELGKVQSITEDSIDIVCEKVLTDCKIGDSIAVNGVCLTVTNILKNSFIADISKETYNVTSLNQLKNGNTVNLERAIKADGRFGGHIVSGHIDGTANILDIKQNGEFYDITIELPKEFSKYVIKKGSIAINGISLTVANIIDNRIKIAVIPHTYENTSLKTLKKQDLVNIEVDIFAKYIEKFLSTGDNKSRIDEDFLRQNGFY